ncbi:MAG: chemotaxis protein CheW [Gemmatimonadota bacterium]
MTRGVTRRLVTFGIGPAWYAVDVAHVERVLRYESVVPIPTMPSWMEGIIEYHGRVVPVIDLRRRFGLPGDVAVAGRRLLVLTLGDDVVAATVDRVVDVRPVADDAIAPPPRLARGMAGEFLIGVVRRPEGMVFVLDVARLLTPDDHQVIDSCLEYPEVPLAAGQDAVVPAAGYSSDV